MAGFRVPPDQVDFINAELQRNGFHHIILFLTAAASTVSFRFRLPHLRVENVAQT